MAQIKSVKAFAYKSYVADIKDSFNDKTFTNVDVKLRHFANIAI